MIKLYTFTLLTLLHQATTAISIQFVDVRWKFLAKRSSNSDRDSRVGLVRSLGLGLGLA